MCTVHPFFTFYLLNNFCEIFHFKKRERTGPPYPPLAPPVSTTPDVYWQHSFLLSMDWIHNIILSSLKLTKNEFYNVSFGQILLQIYDQNSWQMTSSKTFVTSSLWFKHFLVCIQKPNSHFQFEPSIHHFFKKLWQWRHQQWRHQLHFFKPVLENQLLVKTWHFYNFWIGCWTVKAFRH